MILILGPGDGVGCVFMWNGAWVYVERGIVVLVCASCSVGKLASSHHEDLRLVHTTPSILTTNIVNSVTLGHFSPQILCYSFVIIHCFHSPRTSVLQWWVIFLSLAWLKSSCIPSLYQSVTLLNSVTSLNSFSIPFNVRHVETAWVGER